MSNIANIDKNLKVKTTIDKDDVKFYDVLSEPFKVYGVFKEGDRFRRMPESVAKTVSEGVYQLHTCTSGGRVRFKTNSSYVAIHAEMDRFLKMSHFALTGVGGFDLYVKVDGKDARFVQGFTPPLDVTDGYESVMDMPEDMYSNESGIMREITINFPTYSDVKNLYIGLQEGAVVESADDYKPQKPIVYYGSSITHGGCVSRPGMTYEAILTRRFNIDHINLGFSGNAKAEDEMAEYIKGLDMSVFVYDYDHNAPSVEHLKNTHEKLFKIVREAHPNLPIVILSRPKVYLTDTEVERLEVIQTTYNNALESGDKNVYMIKGSELMKLCGNDGTVDGCHPTDLGFFSMAKALGDAMEKWGLV